MDFIIITSPVAIIMVVLATSPVAQGKKSLCIGAFFAKDVSDGGWSSEALVYSLEMALHHINNDSSILKDYRLWYEWRDSKCESGAGIRALLDLVDQNPPHKIAFLGPGCSLAARPVAEATRYFKSVQVGYSITSPVFTDIDKFPHLFRTAPSETMENPARIAILKHFNWNKVAVITQLLDIYTMTKENLLPLLKAENITITSSEGFRDNPHDIIKLLKEKDARIVIGLMYEDKFRQTMCYAYKEGFFGNKIVWLTVGWYSSDWRKATHDVTCTTEELKMASNNVIETAPMDITSSTSLLADNKTARELKDEFNSIILKLNFAKNLYSTFTYDAAWTIARMLNKSIPLLAKYNKTLETLQYKDHKVVDIFIKLLHETDFHGMSGRVTFDKYGDRQTFITIAQNKGGNKTKVGCYDVRNSRLNLTAKGFVWDGGRVPVAGITRMDMMFEEDIQITIIFIILSSIGILFCMFCLTLNCLYRNHRFIKMSSPQFNNVTVLGCCLCYADVLLSTIAGSGLSTFPRLICLLRPWVLSTGFTFAFGGMFAKTYRVYKIFTNTELKKELGPLNNGILFIRLVVYWGGNVGVLIAWQIACPIESKLEKIGEKQPDGDNEDIIYDIKFHRCVSCHYANWVIGILSYQGLLLLFGMFLAWETRNVEHAALNDSKSIALAVYNVFVFSFLTAIMEFVLDYVPTKILLSRIAVYLCCTSTISILFVPKIYHIKHNHSRISDISSMHSTAHRTTNNAGSNHAKTIDEQTIQT